jgi:PHD/YefM family antitoxin component YafN of YafNO toxin-antitoxin module
MQVYSLTEARNNIRAMFDSVYLDNKDVVISLDYYNSLKEINYLLSSVANKK